LASAKKAPSAPPAIRLWPQAWHAPFDFDAGVLLDGVREPFGGAVLLEAQLRVGMDLLGERDDLGRDSVHAAVELLAVNHGGVSLLARKGGKHSRAWQPAREMAEMTLICHSP
jgi:hypothetical protein